MLVFCISLCRDSNANATDLITHNGEEKSNCILDSRLVSKMPNCNHFETAGVAKLAVDKPSFVTIMLSSVQCNVSHPVERY